MKPVNLMQMKLEKPSYLLLGLLAGVVLGIAIGSVSVYHWATNATWKDSAYIYLHPK